MIYATPFILATILYLAFGIRLNRRRKEREARRERAAERFSRALWLDCHECSDWGAPFHADRNPTFWSRNHA